MPPALLSGREAGIDQFSSKSSWVPNMMSADPSCWLFLRDSEWQPIGRLARSCCASMDQKSSVRTSTKVAACSQAECGIEVRPVRPLYV